MKRFLTTTALIALVGTLGLGTAASAQSWHGRHDDRNYSRHYDNDRGYRDNDRGRYDRDRYDRDRYDRGGYRNGWRDRSDWRRGGYVSRGDWNRGYRVDYRRYHLRQPPYGYEWRRVDDNYVLAAVATGLIISIIAGG